MGALIGYLFVGLLVLICLCFLLGSVAIGLINIDLHFLSRRNK